MSLEVFPGEIVGLYGLVGAGRTELAHAVIGISEITGGSILVNGQKAKHRQRRRSAVPLSHRLRQRGPQEGRPHPRQGHHLQHLGDAVAPSRSLARLGARFLGARDRRPHAEALDVSTPSLQQTVGNLSGGNQQKVSIAKWLAAEADILIIDEPTIGIDVKTKDALHEFIWDLARSGKAVLLISSDMPEMVRLADRILVMKGGRIVAEIENSRVYDEMSEEIMKDLA